MERVANNMVSETLVLEDAALEELKAFLDLQVKMVFEALDERIAARNANRGALFGRFDARPSGGSGVLDATVAQEVIPDLNLAAAATSATIAEPSDLNIDAPFSCSTKFQNHVVDVSMPVPACTVAEELIHDHDLAAAASSAFYAKPCDVDIGAFTKCSMKCPSHSCESMASAAVYTAVEEPWVDPILAVAATSDSTSSCIDAPFTASTSNTFAMGSSFKLLEEMRQMELRLGQKLDVQYQILDVAATSAIGTFSNVDLDKEPVFDEGPIFDEEPTVFDKEPAFDEEPVFDREHIPNLVPSSANIDAPSTCSSKFPNLVIATVPTVTEEVVFDLGLAAVYAIAKEPAADATQVQVSMCVLGSALNICKSDCVPYDAIILWVLPAMCPEWQPWPPLMPLQITHNGVVLRPMPWPSFSCYEAEENSSLVLPMYESYPTNWDFSWLWKPSWPLSVRLQNKCVEVQLHVLAWLTSRADTIYNQSSMSGILALGLALLLGLKPPWPPPTRHSCRVMQADQVQAGWGEIWEKNGFPSLQLELQILSIDLLKIKCVLSSSRLHYSVFAPWVLQSEITSDAGEPDCQGISSRGVVIMFSGLIWLLEHSIDLLKIWVELTLWPSSTLKPVLRIGVQLRPYFIFGQSLGVFMLKSESPGGLLTTEVGICVVMSVLTTWARTKAISYSSHGARELFFSTITSYSEKISFLLHYSASCFGIGDYVGNIIFFSYDDAKADRKQLVKICCRCIQKQLSSADMHIVLWLWAVLTEVHATANCFLESGGLNALLSLPTSSLFSRIAYVTASLYRALSAQ